VGAWELGGLGGYLVVLFGKAIAEICGVKSGLLEHINIKGFPNTIYVVFVGVL
jgi:hypothetical protein